MAVAHLEQALQADTGYWPAHHALASILLQSDPKRGARYLDAGLKVAPEEPELLLLQATRLIATDRAGDAVTLLEALVARQPSELTRLMLYRALKAAGQEERTEPLRRRLVQEAADPKKMKQLLEAVDQATAPPERPPPLPKRPPKLTLPDVKL